MNYFIKTFVIYNGIIGINSESFAMEAFVFNCLLEGLPLRLLGFFNANPTEFEKLKNGDPRLYELIAPYLESRDLVALYSRASGFSFKKECIPALHRETNINKLFTEMMQLYKCTTLTVPETSQESFLPFGFICKLLNPIPGRETYVLKRPVHFWMYEDILSHHNVDKLLEIGIFYGGSTHAWRLRLPDVKLYSLDINQPLQDSKILDRCQSLFVQGSAVDIADIKKVCTNSPFDMIIDDASHLVSHQIFTFLQFVIEKACCKIYVIEDINLEDKSQFSFMNFFQSMIHYQSTLNANAFVEDLQKFVTDDTREIFAHIANNIELIEPIAHFKMVFYGDSLCIHM